jgi:hypothetical protein
MKRAIIVLGIVLSLACLPLLCADPSTPSDAALEVIARNGADKDKHLPSINGVVPAVMARPDQTVPVTLQFPSAQAGTPVAVVPLDGGRIESGNRVVLPNGKVMFTFRPGALSGRFRVMVHTPAEHHALEFCVIDPNHDPRQPRH